MDWRLIAVVAVAVVLVGVFFLLRFRNSETSDVQNLFKSDK